jgi:NADPH-dependent curcumin reductase CurA
MQQVTSIIFRDYVNAGAVPTENFVPQVTNIDSSSLNNGDIYVQLLYLSVDPYLRMMMKDVMVKL